MTKRLFALLLGMLLLVCPMLASCNNTSGGTESTPAVSDGNTSGTTSGGEGTQNSKYQDEKGNYTVENLDMPEFNFNKDTFTVCVTSKEGDGTYFSEEIAPDLYDTTDSVLNEAVKARNDLISEKYGVEIIAYQVKNVATTVSQDATTGTATYDAALPFMGQAASLAQQNMLYDLNDFADYIHLDAPWWDQDANSNLSIAGKLYFTTGDISIMQKIVSSAILFNKNIYNEVFAQKYGSLYDIVRDGKWTLDLMVEMGREVTYETDDIAGMNFEDHWGMIGTNGIGGFFIASGNKLIAKDQNDIPYLQFGSEASLLYAEKVLKTFQDSSWFANTQKLTPTWPEPNVWEGAMGAFGNDRTLFYPSAFSAVKKLRNYDVAGHMGIIPSPKASEEQDTYYTSANIYYAYGICIPTNVEDAEFSAYMIELMAAGGKNHITPAYYEVTLKGRDAKDFDSENMLDNYIFNNVVYDLGVLYDFGGINSMFASLMSSDDTNVASHLEGIEGKIQDKIDEYVEAYELNG
ncbi:MAG: hypothetical protein E7651_02790 [Ruminococcaceae bacterium]|nr:hypothetical protein [Oscillospiraceae bacterium]